MDDCIMSYIKGNSKCKLQKVVHELEEGSKLKISAEKTQEKMLVEILLVENFSCRIVSAEIFISFRLFKRVCGGMWGWGSEGSS